jgi:hypothetical protein
MDQVIDNLAMEAAHAVALAEGFFVADSLPARCFNPGDLELGDRGWGVEQGKTIYVKADWQADINDHTDGCSALRREWIAILSGASHEYNLRMKFIDLAMRWTDNDNPGAWAKIVCANLEVDPTATIEEWITSRADQGETE